MSQQDLISAIRNGEVDQVAEILHSSGLDSQEDLRGHLLLIAVEEDQPEVVKLLCRDGRWSNVVRSDDLSPIHVACKYGNVDIIETLLRNGSEVNERTPEHLLSPLLMAVRWGQKEAVCHLLDSGADPSLISSRYRQLTTPLHEAVIRQNEDIVNYLLARNADVNLVNGRRELPLHLVCGAKSSNHGQVRVRVAKRLIACGSSVTGEDMNGNTPLHLAVSSDIVDGTPELVRVLCVSGAFINAYNQAGDTPLHRVAASNSTCKDGEHIQVITQQLINFGANVNKESYDGRIPLQDALLGQFNLKLLDMLISAGSDINQIDSNGESVFYKTTKVWGCLESTRYLIRKGIKYDTVSHKMMCPLTSACNAGHGPTIHLIASECPALLDPREKLPDITDRPLTCVVKLFNIDMVVFLLNAGYKWSRAELRYLLEWPALQNNVAVLIKGLLDKGQPHTLKVLSRDVIRFRLKDNVWEKVQSLPLPEILKKHLLLYDVRMCGSSFNYLEA